MWLQYIQFPETAPGFEFWGFKNYLVIKNETIRRNYSLSHRLKLPLTFTSNYFKKVWIVSTVILTDFTPDFFFFLVVYPIPKLSLIFFRIFHTFITLKKNKTNTKTSSDMTLSNHFKFLERSGLKKKLTNGLVCFSGT